MVVMLVSVEACYHGDDGVTRTIIPWCYGNNGRREGMPVAMVMMFVVSGGLLS